MIKVNTVIKGLEQEFFIKITNIKTNLGDNSVATFGYFLTEDTEAIPANALELKNISFNYTDSIGLEEQIYLAIEAELKGTEYKRVPSKVEQLEKKLAEMQEALDLVLITNLEGSLEGAEINV